MADINWKGKTGKWTRYGGGFMPMNKHEGQEWVCQCCAETQPKGSPEFMLEALPGDFIRICPMCEHTKQSKQIKTFLELKNLRSPKRGW